MNDTELKKRRMNFLKEKLISKKTELREIIYLQKCEQARFNVKMFHHNDDNMLIRKHEVEKERIIAEIKKLDFEIEDLQSELEENVVFFPKL